MDGWTLHKADEALHGFDHFVMTPGGFLGYMPKDVEGGGPQLFTAEDGRMIAACPDMLSALLEAVDCGIVPSSGVADSGPYTHPRQARQARCADMIRAAITKATIE